MNMWFREVTSRLTCLLFDDEGATATEYAVIITLLVLAVIVSIDLLANWDGTGILQTLYNLVADLIGQFGSIE